MADRIIKKLPSAEQLSKEVDAYFDLCAGQNTPVTPSGLALALGVRTSALNDNRLSAAQQEVIERAMQRIEASTMELLLTKGGVKGIESVLGRVEENGAHDRLQNELRRLSDEELRQRLKKLLPKIEKAVSK
jgi:hypothetical protein